MGTPKRGNKFSNSAREQDSAVASDIGVVSGQRVKRSTIVNNYGVPREDGSGPMICPRGYCRKDHRVLRTVVVAP